MLGKLTWAAIPFDSRLPLVAAAVVGLVIGRRPRLITLKGWVPYSLAGMDHQRRPQADRRDVRAARRGDAAARLHRRPS